MIRSRRRYRHHKAAKATNVPEVRNVPMRWDFINRALGGSGRYLEVGIQRGVAGKKVRATEKWGVDPAPLPEAQRYYTKVFSQTSDDFFEELDRDEKFDVVFVDGLHHAEQVYRDIIHALEHLATGGTVLAHDCSPTTEKMQRREPQPGQWTGDCWKAIARLRSERADLQVRVANTDFGIGIIRKGGYDRPIDLPVSWESLTWQHLQADRQRLLGLVSAKDGLALLNKPKPKRVQPSPITQIGTDSNWRVVIPSNDSARLRKSVASVLKAHPSIPAEWIIVVDDGARSGWRSTDPTVSWVPGIKPFVYARNVNLGIRAAGPYDIVVMGDDVEVQTHRAFDSLRSDKSITSASIVGPVGNPKQSWKTGCQHMMTVNDPVAFICVYLPHGLLNSVGELDERFVDYGCEDTDYCWRAQQKGFSLAVNHQVVVQHNGPGMQSAFRSKPLKRNRPLLLEKWPEKKP